MTAMTPVGSVRSHIVSGNGGALPPKWKLLKAAEEAREPLGLKRTSLAVLRTMISLVKTDHISDAAADHHICFASNATLAERVHVSLKTIERHISILAAAGLIRRISSGNGKRWARRDRQGRVVLASGLSLLPLAEKHAELVQTAQGHAEKTRKVSLLKDKCSLKLKRLTDLSGDESVITDLMSRARNILRRKSDETALKNLLEEITNELANCGYVEEQTDKLRGPDHQNEGHKETDLIQKVEEKNSSQIQVSPKDMEHSFPKLCAELRFAKSNQHCEELMTDLAEYLGIGSIWNDLKTDHGPAVSFILLGFALQKAEVIENHKAYLLSLSKKIRAGEISYKSLLTKRDQ